MRLNTFALFCATAALPMLVAAAAAAAPAKNSKLVLSTPKSQASDPAPAFGVRPSWVTSQKEAAIDPKHKEDPFQLLLSNSQEYLSKDAVENYVEYVVAPLNQAGLQGVGTISIPWNVGRTDLTINDVSIERNGKTIDALNKDDVSVLRRETKLEQSTLTGVRTVVMPVRGLEVGDKLRVAFTYKTLPRRLGQTEEVQDMAVPLSIARVVRRLIVSKDLSARWSIDPAIKPAAVIETPTSTERLFVVDSAEPPKSRHFVPDRFTHSLIQVSAFSSWADVVDDVAPMFEAARKVPDNSEVTALADKIAAEHKDPRERMLAALRLTQDQVRYVALLLGDGDYKPMPAEEVWEKRFGDCKGKSTLLLALLDRLGVQAEPVMASVKFDDLIGKSLPSLAMLDHVYVRAHLGPDTYYLDGTQYGQRTLEELKTGTTLHVLPLVPNASIVTIPDAMPSAPLLETQVVWDARAGIADKVPFEATLILRGATAAEMRAAAAISTDRDELIKTYKNKVAGVSNDVLEYVSTDAEAADGSYIVKFNGKAQLDWNLVEGLKGNRFELIQAPLNWDGELDRDSDGQGKDFPVLMAFPYWERTVEKLLLPDGGRDFTLDVPAVNQTVAATKLSRTVEMTGGVVTAISDFKRLSRELDAAAARAAKPELEKVNSTYGYVVSKRKLRIAKN